MALKQVVDTTKNTYLTKRFEDDEGNQYGDVAAKSLVAWYRLSDRTPGTELSAANIVNGTQYIILVVGNTNNWSALGASSNTPTVGEIFTASSTTPGIPGGGTHGTVIPYAPQNLSTNKFYDDESTPVLVDVGATYGASTAAPALSTSKIGEIFYNVATFGADATDRVNIGTAVEWDHIIGNESSSTKKMTLSAWIYKTGDGGNSSGRIFSFGKDIILLTTSDETVRFYAELNGSTAQWNTGPNTFTLNAWTHIAVSYDASSSATSDPKIYINSKLVDVTLASGSKNATYSGITTEACFVGNNSDFNRAFAGSIAEACVWNQTLTIENIKAIYNVSQVRFTRNQTVSGFLNHSPRIQSIENINHHDTHGKFDDTRTIDFIDPRQVAVLKIKKRPGDARTITITDPHDATGDTSGAHSASATITYTNNPFDGDNITLISTDGTTKTYEFDNNGTVTAGSVSVTRSGSNADTTFASLKTAVEGSSGHNGKILVTHTNDNNDTGTITFKQLLGGLPGNTTIVTTLSPGIATVPSKFTGASSPTTGKTSSTSKTFEFQLGVFLTSGNIEVNIKDTKTPAQVARKLVSAINSNSSPGGWSFTATQTKPNEVTIMRGRIDSATACTVSTTAPERFVEVTSKFKAKPQTTSVYPSLEVADSVHLLERKNYGGSTRSDIKIVRPVSRITPLRPKKVSIPDPFNETHAHAAFGFEEGIESVSPEKDIDSDFYVSGSASAIAPESIKNRKKIVLDMPVSQNTDLQLVTNANRSETNSNFPMAYYNFTDKAWQKIGLGSGSFAANPAGTAAARQTQFNQALDFTMVGFTPSKGLKAWRVADRSSGTPNEAVGFERLGAFEFSPKDAISFKNGSTQHPKVLNVGSLASPTNVFGFPAHPKFHATGSQELSMSTHITKPFVLEKIVYEFNVGMKGSSLMNTLSSDADADSVSVDFDTVTFFILNQREAAVGKELSEVPRFRVADSNGGTAKSRLAEVVSYTNPICPSGKEIPRVLQLSLKPDTYTGKVIPATGIKPGKKYKIVTVGSTNWSSIGGDSDPAIGEIFTANTTAPTAGGTAIEIDGKDTEVSTIRDLVTWSRLTSSPSGFNSVYLDAFAKDVRKDSDLVLTPDDNTYPFGSSRKISYTGQPSDGSTVKLVSSDGTTKTYEFDGNSSHTAGNVRVIISGDDADATYAALKTAVLSASGHDGKILVTHTDNNNNAGDIIFHMGPKKYSIAAECITPVVQITSGSIDVGAAALGEIASTVTYFGITNTTTGIAPNRLSVNTIDATTQTGQTISLSKNAIGRTLAGIQSGRSLLGENPSSKHLYTFRGLKIGDAKITAYEKDFGVSPYIILPTDKLVIGCQAPISSALDGTHPQIRLGSGDGRIILYGYELEKEHPSYKSFSKDSTGNSSFLSENIGDIAVRDEFETHPRMTYYRSSIDEVVTGSMLPKSVGADFGTQQQIDARQVVGRNSQGTQGETGSLLRGRRLQDRSERYYDSMIPDLRSLMQADAVNTVDLTGNSNSGIVLGVAGSDATYKSLDATGVQAGTKVIWDNWFSSFPFEPRYNSISTARLPSIRKSIPTKTQTGATKSSQVRTSVDHVALALFENTGTLGVVGNVAGSYSSTAILDNPTINENTNRLIPGGRSSSMFVNTPSLTDTEVYVSWTAQDIAATGSIEILSALDTVEESRLLNMKTLSISSLANGSSTPVEEKFIFSYQGKLADTNHVSGETKVSTTPPVLTVSYSESAQVNEFSDMLIQIPTTGSLEASSGIKFFLDSAGTNASGDSSTNSSLDHLTRVNKGFLAAIGSSGTNLNDMWTTGSVVQIDKVQSSNGIDVVDTSGTTITAGGVGVNTPLILFNDSGGNELERFVQLDRLVNSFDKDDVSRTTGVTSDSPDALVDLKFKHIKAVNTSAHASLNEPPDTDEDIVVEISPGSAATARITVSDGNSTDANDFTEKDFITIESTDGTVRKYVLVDTSTGSGHAAANSKLTANSVTGAGKAGTSNIGAIAVQFARGTDSQNDYLVALRSAIQNANGHAGKITVSSVPTEANGSQFITITQSKAGLSGNTAISKNIGVIASVNFTGGACLAPSGGDNTFGTNAVWGLTIDHSSMSRSDGFVENNFKIGQGLRLRIGTNGGGSFGALSSKRVNTHDGNTQAQTSYSSPGTPDGIRFGIRHTDASGQTSDVYYQFYAVDSDEVTISNLTYTYDTSATTNEAKITAASGLTNQTGAGAGSEKGFTYFFRSEKTLSSSQNMADSESLRLTQARLLAQAINAASQFEVADADGHIRGSFAATATQDGTYTYINIYLTSFAQGTAALSPPLFIDVDGSTTNGGAVAEVRHGGGRADPFFVSIRQTSASIADAYGFVDLQIKSDLDPEGAFLTYDTAETSDKKASMISVNISNATTVDDIFSELASTINITSSQSTSAIRPMNSMLVATHDSTANTLSLTYNIPVAENDYKPFLNKVLLPLPGARYDVTGLRPGAASLTHRVISITGKSANTIASTLNSAISAAKNANSADSITWSPTVLYPGTRHAGGSASNNVIDLTQPGKGLAGNVSISTSADSSLISTLGFGGGESAIYGDGDIFGEPTDVNPDSFAKSDFTASGLDMNMNAKTLAFTVGSQSYSGTISTTTAAASSTSTVIGVQGALGQALITFSVTGTPAAGDTIEIITHDGTLITATANAGTTTSTDTNNPTFDINSGNTSTITSNIASCLNANSKITGSTMASTVPRVDDSAGNITAVKLTMASGTPLSITSPGSPSTLIGEALATGLKQSLDLAFASQKTEGLVNLARNSEVVTFNAKNKFHILAATPVPTGTSLNTTSPAGPITVTDWSGADLVKITGSPLKRKSVQKGVVENDPEDVDTLKFASISASGNTARFYAPFVDAQDKKFLLGTDIDAGSDYYSKVFFGAGEGPSKSPKFTLSENSDISVTATSNYSSISLVEHNGDTASALGGQAAQFTYTGVSNKIVPSGNNAAGVPLAGRNTGGGTSYAFTAGDVLPGFTASSERRIDLSTEILAGNTVHIRYAAASWDSGATSGNVTAPTLTTGQGLNAENADSSDDGIFVQASIDGGLSYQDVTTLFSTTIDDVAVTSSELFTSTSGGATLPVYGSPRFDLASTTPGTISGDGTTVGNDNSDNEGSEVVDGHDVGIVVVDGVSTVVRNIDTGSGRRYYPLMTFTVTSNVKLRFIQKQWSSQSASFDHWWLRFLKIYVETPGANDGGESSVALTGRANYDQTAIATNVEIRGAKYGLVSPIKLNTSAIFRAGSFGQVRDMLEQRPLTRTFDGVRVSEPPVAVSFQERMTKRAISPEETNSANLDIFCTSSLPYFDGLTKDRTSEQPDLVDEIDIDITV